MAFRRSPVRSRHPPLGQLIQPLINQGFMKNCDGLGYAGKCDYVDFSGAQKRDRTSGMVRSMSAMRWNATTRQGCKAGTLSDGGLFNKERK